MHFSKLSPCIVLFLVTIFMTEYCLGSIIVRNPTLKLAVEAEAYVTKAQGAFSKVSQECNGYKSTLISIPTLTKLASKSNFTIALHQEYPRIQSTSQVWVTDPNPNPNPNVKPVSCTTATIDGNVIMIQKTGCDQAVLFGICFGGPLPEGI